MITTHVLDTARGKPATGVAVQLARHDGTAYVQIARGVTDLDGRCKTLTSGPVDVGTYQLTFATGDYLGGATFFPSVSITFTVADGSQHYHVPLLLSPYGYSTYRGS